MSWKPFHRCTTSILTTSFLAVAFWASPALSQEREVELAEITRDQLLQTRRVEGPVAIDATQPGRPSMQEQATSDIPQSEDGDYFSDESEGTVAFDPSATRSLLGHRMEGMDDVNVHVDGYPVESLERDIDDRRALEFLHSSHVPGYGVDPALHDLVMAGRHAHEGIVHGFVLLDGRMNADRRARIEALDVKLLGRHANHFKAAIPIGQLDTLADLNFVEWVGASRLEQRICPDLHALRDQARAEGKAWDDKDIPIFVNLFDDDPDGYFARHLEEQGATIGRYYDFVRAYTAIVKGSELDQLADNDFVLFVEPIRKTAVHHDASVPLLGGDRIRPDGVGTRFDGSETTVGIMDTGFDLTGHVDLDKNACGFNFTDDDAGVWEDERTHGTHVLGTIVGTGTSDIRYQGMAPGVGSSGSTRIRAAKIWDSTGTGTDDWYVQGFEWMGQEEACDSIGVRPLVVNVSGGRYSGSAGTNIVARTADSITWDHRQLYIASAGNSGLDDDGNVDEETVGEPGSAKTVLAVGNVRPRGFELIGEIWPSSSRGPTADSRLKPNVVAPGRSINSVAAGTTDGYSSKTGTSMAAPHVTGLAATLMHHRSFYRERPWATRARLMAAGLLHDDDTNLSERNTYGFGRVSSYMTHWSRNNPDGWTYWTSSRFVNDSNYGEREITVQPGTERLAIVMTWDEPAASAGASSARLWDLELWVDEHSTCAPEDEPSCGDHRKFSLNDNVVWFFWENPPAGTHNVKIVPWDAPDNYSLRAGMVIKGIRGNPQPPMEHSLSASVSRVTPGESFEITSTVSTPAWVAGGVHLQNTDIPSGFTRTNVVAHRQDGQDISFGTTSNFTLGEVIQANPRETTWSFDTFSWINIGCYDLEFRAWSANAGTATETVSVCVPDESDDLFHDRFEQ